MDHEELLREVQHIRAELQLQNAIQYLHYIRTSRQPGDVVIEKQKRLEQFIENCLAINLERPSNA